jgi:hypothetical protein
MNRLLVKIAFLLGIMMLIIPIGCSSTNSIPPAFSSSPSVKIISPSQGAIVSGDVLISVAIYNFVLSDPSIKKNAPSQGHFEFCIYPSSSTPTPSNIFGGECTLTSAIYSITTLTQPGTYTISAELKNNDDTPFSPPVTDTVDIVISGQVDHQISLLLNIKYYYGATD